MQIEKRKTRFQVGILLFAIIAFITLGVFMYKMPVHVCDWERMYNNPKSYLSSDTTTKKAEIAKEVFDAKFNKYLANIDELKFNLKFQAMFVIFAIMVIWKVKDEVTLPYLQLNVNVSFVYLIITGGLLLFWIIFGFLLNDLISDRMKLLELIKIRYSDSSKAAHSSLYSMLRDNFFIDLWFYVNKELQEKFHDRPDFVYNFMNSINNLLIYVLYAGFQGFTHFCMILFIIKKFNRHNNVLIYTIMAVTVVTILVFTHALFYWGGLHTNSVQKWILIWSIVFLSIAIIEMVLFNSHIRKPKTTKKHFKLFFDLQDYGLVHQVESSNNS